MVIKPTSKKLITSIVITIMWLLIILLNQPLYKCISANLCPVNDGVIIWGKFSFLRGCCKISMSFMDLVREYIFLLIIPFSITYLITSIFQRSRK